MTNIVAALVFAGYVLLATVAATRRSRRAVHAFLAYGLAASFAVGLTQRDLWPFSSWPLVAGLQPPTVTQRRIVAVDARGVEHDVDYRAWYPLSAAELNSWMGAVFLDLDPRAQDEAAAWLTHLADSARAASRETGELEAFARFLGPATAPFFLVSPVEWPPNGVPQTPFAGIRFYLEHWSPEGVHAGRDTVSRELVYESPELR